jgi:hypothetical protein
MVDVVREPDRDAPRMRIAQCAADGCQEVVGKVQVVDRDVEGMLRRADERGKRLRGLGGRLAAVGQRADFDRLYSRFAAW